MNEDELQAVLDQEALVDRIDRGAMPDWVESHWRTSARASRTRGTARRSRVSSGPSRSGRATPVHGRPVDDRHGRPAGPPRRPPRVSRRLGRPQRAGVARRLLQAAGRTAVRIGVPRDAVARPAVPPRPRPRAVARQPPGRTRRPVLGVLLRRRADVPRVAPPSTTTARAGTVPSGWRSRSSRARCSSRSASPPTPRPDSALAT